MSSPAPPPQDLRLFQAFQRAQRLLWRELQPTVPDEPHDATAQFEREHMYRDRLHDLESSITAEFDVPQQRVREVMLRGVLDGWPWENA